MSEPIDRLTEEVARLREALTSIRDMPSFDEHDHYTMRDRARMALAQPEEEEEEE
ncbi:MAG: hypothetical protein ABI162_06785 [Luteolibacter sp.]